MLKALQAEEITMKNEALRTKKGTRSEGLTEMMNDVMPAKPSSDESF